MTQHSSRWAAAAPAIAGLLLAVATGMAACGGRSHLERATDRDKATKYTTTGCPVLRSVTCPSISQCDSVLNAKAGITRVSSGSESDKQRSYLKSWMCDESKSKEVYAWAKTQTASSSQGGGAKVGYGPFSFGASSDSASSNGVAESEEAFRQWQSSKCGEEVKAAKSEKVSSALSQIRDTTAGVKAWSMCVRGILAMYNDCQAMSGVNAKGATLVQGVFVTVDNTDVAVDGAFTLSIRWCGRPGSTTPFSATLTSVAVFGADCPETETGKAYATGAALCGGEHSVLCKRTSGGQVTIKVSVRADQANGDDVQQFSKVIGLPPVCGGAGMACCPGKKCIYDSDVCVAGTCVTDGNAQMLPMATAVASGVAKAGLAPEVVTASCPAGYGIIGGNCDVDPTGTLNGTLPRGAAWGEGFEGWSCTAFGRSNDARVTAHAVCLRKDLYAGYSGVKKQKKQGAQAAVCPQGTRVVAVGARTAEVARSHGAKDGEWKGGLHQFTVGPNKIKAGGDPTPRVRALCLSHKAWKSAGYTIAVGKGHHVCDPGKTNHEALAKCPAGTVAIQAYCESSSGLRVVSHTTTGKYGGVSSKSEQGSCVSYYAHKRSNRGCDDGKVPEGHNAAIICRKPAGG